jgi:hypothetical protein
MKKFLPILVIILSTIFVSSVQAFTITSCSIEGNETNIFYANDTVYVESVSNITPITAPVDIYIINDVNTYWIEGMVLVDVSTGKRTIATNSSGYLEISKIWSPILIPGYYDIVVDANRDGMYNTSIDFIDNSTATGFEVLAIPAPTLDFSVGSNSPTDHTWNLNYSGYNTMLQLKLTAGPVEDVKINSIYLSASGTGNDKTGIRVAHLILDDNGNGIYDQDEKILSFGQYLKDDGILAFNIENGYNIPINRTVYMIIVYSMTNSNSSNGTYSFQISSISAAGAYTEKQVTMAGFPISSARKTVRAATTTETTTTVSTSTSSETTITTTTIPTTTTTSVLPSFFKSKWFYIVLIAFLIIGIVTFVIIFIRRGPTPGSGAGGT